jgi:hypothetical protein
MKQIWSCHSPQTKVSGSPHACMRGCDAYISCYPSAPVLASIQQVLMQQCHVRLMQPKRPSCPMQHSRPYRLLHNKSRLTESYLEEHVSNYEHSGCSGFKTSRRAACAAPCSLAALQLSRLIHLIIATMDTYTAGLSSAPAAAAFLGIRSCHQPWCRPPALPSCTAATSPPLLVLAALSLLCELLLGDALQVIGYSGAVNGPRGRATAGNGPTSRLRPVSGSVDCCHSCAADMLCESTQRCTAAAPKSATSPTT